MNEQETPQETPAPTPPPATDQGGGASPNRGVMIVLSYLWILFLIPLLIEKDDSEVQWHAKHGLVLTVAEIIIQIMLNVIVATGIGCLFAFFIPLVFLAFAVIRLISIVKGLNGERFMVPGISQYAEKF
jgi:uncharacterized membrane protein